MVKVVGVLWHVMSAILYWLQGLLQSEVEGVENENVGFYGRCLLHATHPLRESGSGPIDSKLESSGEKELTCARTEVLRPLIEVFLLLFYYYFFPSILVFLPEDGVR